jgi:DNA polymerase-4
MLPLYSFPHRKNLNYKLNRNRNKFFIHLDLDAFYAQVEERDNPKLKGKPISVGGTKGDKGIVMTANYKARDKGVAIGMSVLEARKLCPNLISIPCYGTKYEAISQNILEHIAELLPGDCIEQYSVDECFLDISPVAKNYLQATAFAWKLKKMVWELENLTVSIGLSYNKSYAKLGTKFNKPDGLTVIQEENKERIYELPVQKLWGIGHRMELRFNALGIRTIGELAGTSIHKVHKEFGINGVILRKIARGEDTSGITEYGGERVEKSFSHNHTLSDSIYDEPRAVDEIRRMSEYICRRMRTKDLITDHVGLSVRYEHLGYQGGKVKLWQPTNSEKEIFQRAVDIYKTLPQPHAGCKIRTFGISVFQLHKVTGYNLNFFNRDHLIPYKQMDFLKDKHGENIIRLGLDNS